MTGGLFRFVDSAVGHIPMANAYYFKQWTDFHMPFHAHDSTEIMYVIDGNCKVELQSDPNNLVEMQLKKGEFVILDARTPHRLEVTSACRMLNVEFTLSTEANLFVTLEAASMYDEALKELLHEETSHIMLRDPSDVYHVLKRLVLELDSSAADSPMIGVLFLQLLMYIARLRTEQGKTHAEQGHLYIKQTISFIHQNYDRDIQVKDIALAVSLHPGYLQRIFKSHMGMTLTEMLTKVRMDKAKMLLQNTDIPIEDISDYVGVGSRQYFHLLFKKSTGMTPASFRRSVNKSAWDGRNYLSES